jgi:hypothetical protein
VKVLFKHISLSRDGKEYPGQERYFFGFRFVGNYTNIKIREGEVRSYLWASLDSLKDFLLFDNQLQETRGKIEEIFPDYKSLS